MRTGMIVPPSPTNEIKINETHIENVPVPVQAVEIEIQPYTESNEIPTENVQVIQPSTVESNSNENPSPPENAPASE
jgi:hypothetical protein